MSVQAIRACATLPPPGTETEGRVTPPAPPDRRGVDPNGARAGRRPDRGDRPRPGRPARARARPDAAARAFVEALVAEGLASSEGVARILAARHRLPLVDLRLAGVSAEADHADPAARPPASGRAAVPARRRDVLHVAVADPENVQAIDELRLATRYQLSLGVATRDEIVTELDRHRPGPGGRRASRLGKTERSLGDPRSRGGGRRHRGAGRPHRQLDHPPGGRGRGERRPLRGAGGRPRRPVPDRRRPARGAADPARGSPPG